MLDMSSLTNTAKKSSHSESLTDTLTERQSLLTCVSSCSPVQPSSIEELRTWLVAAFPASHSQSPDQSEGTMTREICGLQQPTLFASSDLPAFSWKTCRDYLASTTPKAYSLTLPKWGMWDATGLYPQQTPELGTGEKGFGLWQNWATPNTLDSLPPKSAEALEREATVSRPGRTNPANLRDQVSNRKNWPSPTCSDVYTGNLKSSQQKPGSMHSVTLPQAVAMWPTPDANMGARGSFGEWNPIGGNGHQRQYPINQAVLDIEGSSQLNPDWTEWLMGWPVGWTNIEPLGELDWRDWSVDPADIGEVPRVTSVKENRANRLKAIGNGQVPQCVVMAWESLA